MTLIPRSTPEAQGIPSIAVTHFLDSIKKEGLELHSLMLLRHGHVVAEGWWSPYEPDGIHLLYSLSKSFTATAIGLAVYEGLLSIEDKVMSFFPRYAQTKASHLESLKVRHLLSMATGHKEDTLNRLVRRAQKDWVESFLAYPPEKEPGSLFCYNNGATFMLSAILKKLTGLSLVEYLSPRLFEPLGINKAYWQENPQGVQLGFSGLHITTESIAKFGQLYLQEGVWSGKQLIAKDWIELAKSKHIDSSSPGQEPHKYDWQQGYGFQFWMCRHNAYRGDGAFSQFCVILPEQDAVLVTTGGEDDMQAILDAFWTDILPTFEQSALEENDELHKSLEHTLSTLEYPPVAGEQETLFSKGLHGKSYEFVPEKPLTNGFPEIHGFVLEASLDGYLLTLKGSKDHHLKAGFDNWLAAQSSFYDYGLAATRASAAWHSETTFKMQVRYIETPHMLTILLHFKDNQAELKMNWNAHFDGLEFPEFMAIQL